MLNLFIRSTSSNFCPVEDNPSTIEMDSVPDDVLDNVENESYVLNSQSCNIIYDFFSLSSPVSKTPASPSTMSSSSSVSTPSIKSPCSPIKPTRKTKSDEMDELLVQSLGQINELQESISKKSKVELDVLRETNCLYYSKFRIQQLLVDIEFPQESTIPPAFIHSNNLNHPNNYSGFS